MKNKIVVIDFDSVLFNTSSFFVFVRQICLECGISEELFTRNLENFLQNSRIFNFFEMSKASEFSDKAEE